MYLIIETENSVVVKLKEFNDYLDAKKEYIDYVEFDDESEVITKKDDFMENVKKFEEGVVDAINYVHVDQYGFVRGYALVEI